MAIISLLSAFGPGTPLAGAISGHRCFANYWFARSVFATIRVWRLQTSKTVDHNLSISPRVTWAGSNSRNGGAQVGNSLF